MAPGIHPACTPSSSCAPIRCHPTPPPCSRPEACLRRTTSKNIKPCVSAVSIMSTRSRSVCSSCSARSRKKKDREVLKYLKRKSYENRIKKNDRIKGTHRYTKYRRRCGGQKKKSKECCAGKGHRGRLRRSGRCVIL